MNVTERHRCISVGSDVCLCSAKHVTTLSLYLFERRVRLTYIELPAVGDPRLARNFHKAFALIKVLHDHKSSTDTSASTSSGRPVKVNIRGI